MAYKSRVHSEHSSQVALYEYVRGLNKKIRGKRRPKNKYPLSSVYIFDWSRTVRKKKMGYRWESDFFFLDTAYMAWEIEIKCDRQDFDRERFKDTKKKKHDLLMQTYETNNENGWVLPNYFYYCAPTGMIKVEELQPYAGLIELDDDHNISIVHNSKIHDFIDRDAMNGLLLNKFYNKSLKEEKVNIDFNLNTRQTIKDITKNLDYSKNVNKLVDQVREFHRKKRIA